MATELEAGSSSASIPQVKSTRSFSLNLLNAYMACILNTGRNLPYIHAHTDTRLCVCMCVC